LFSQLFPHILAAVFSADIPSVLPPILAAALSTLSQRSV
jgi:hypothetical protein